MTSVFSNALVGVDGREGGRDAHALAKQLLSDGGVISPAHVWFIDPRQPLFAPQVEHTVQRERALEGLIASLGPAEATAQMLSIAATSVGEGLRDLAIDQHADLIVIGTCRRGVVGRAVVGDDARSVLEQAPCPVALAPAGFSQSPAGLETIGVAYDGSPESEEALAIARKLAAVRKASLSAFEAVPVPVYVRDPWNVEDAIDGAMDAARERIAALGDIEPRVAAGSASKQLARYGASVDLLVIGEHRHGRIGSRLHPSASRRLSGSSSFPMLVG